MTSELQNIIEGHADDLLSGKKMINEFCSTSAHGGARKIAIHIFNPEADYALAEFKESYTPPAQVVKLRRSLALTPMRFAREGDVILLLDEPFPVDSKETSTSTLMENPEICDATRESNNGDQKPAIIPPTGFREFFKIVSKTPEKYEIRPWNWTPDLKHRLRLAGAPASLLPSDDYLRQLREIASRATTISFNYHLNKHLTKRNLKFHCSPLPDRFEDTEEAIRWMVDNGGRAFFKYPWSSSGRGVLLADSEQSIHKIKQWIAGGIRRQGYVMGETVFPKVIDFATEWHISHGQAIFLGVSFFEASETGNYVANTLAPQTTLREIINRAAPDLNDDFIEAQKESLQQVISRIAPDYDGFVGIDMMAAQDGQIRGGVELNFRMTMGISALLEQSRIES